MPDPDVLRIRCLFILDMPPASQVAEESGAAIFALLKLTCAAADAFPPLKSAAGGALYITEIVAVDLCNFFSG